MYGRDGDPLACLEVGCTERCENDSTSGWTSYLTGMVCPMHSARAGQAALDYESASAQSVLTVSEAFTAGIAWLYHDLEKARKGAAEWEARRLRIVEVNRDNPVPYVQIDPDVPCTCPEGSYEPELDAAFMASCPRHSPVARELERRERTIRVPGAVYVESVDITEKGIEVTMHSNDPRLEDLNINGLSMSVHDSDVEDYAASAALTRKLYSMENPEVDVPKMADVIEAVHKASRVLGMKRLPQRLELTEDESDALIELIKASFPMVPTTMPLQPSMYGIELVVRLCPQNPDFPKADELRAQLRAKAAQKAELPCTCTPDIPENAYAVDCPRHVEAARTFAAAYEEDRQMRAKYPDWSQRRGPGGQS